MKITHPVYFLAIAAALISSLTTQAYGQTAESVLACEQFNTAIAERGNATVVSGIELEETSFVEFFNFGAPFFEQVVDATTAQLTLPSGTLTKVSSTGVGVAFVWPNASDRLTFLKRQTSVSMILLRVYWV